MKFYLVQFFIFFGTSLTHSFPLKASPATVLCYGGGIRYKAKPFEFNSKDQGELTYLLNSSLSISPVSVKRIDEGEKIKFVDQQGKVLIAGYLNTSELLKQSITKKTTLTNLGCKEVYE